MKLQASSISFFFVIALAEADNQLYVKNLTCDATYPVTVIGASFSCDAGCAFGSTGGFKSLLSYEGLEIQDLYTTSLMNFTAFTNETAYSSVSDTGFSQQMFFGSMIDLCENYTDDSSCMTDSGNFTASFDYTIPSAGSLNSYFSGFTVESNLRVYDYYNNMDLVGDCLLLLTTEAPPASYNAYTRVGAHTGFYFAAAAAVICALVFLLPPPPPKDEKKKSLLPKGNDIEGSFDEDLQPDVIERERSVFKHGLSPKQADFTDQLISVREETVNITVTEQIVTEEIPWPSKEDDSFDLETIDKPVTVVHSVASPQAGEAAAPQDESSIDPFEATRAQVDPSLPNTVDANVNTEDFKST